MRVTLFFLFCGAAAAFDLFSIKTLLPSLTTTTYCPTPTPTPCPTSVSCDTLTPTPTPTQTTGSCVIPLPTTTLTCQSKEEACRACGDSQICVQRAEEDDHVYSCPRFECQNCPEPVCNPPCGCKEECVVTRVEDGKCPVGQCRPLPVCRDCPPVSCAGMTCPENWECKEKLSTCMECGSASCVPKPCLDCPTEPPTCFCPRGTQCKLVEGSCYKCPTMICEPIPDPCADCPGECAVTPHPNCDTCPPLRRCVEKCRECSFFLPSWTCSNPRDALYISRTCTTCSEYRCLNECKQCPAQPAACPCENQEDCVLQPRSCDQCATYYCKNECVKPGPAAPCKCDDANLCVYREGNCFTNAYYECVPPGKGTTEPLDLVKGRAMALKRNYA